MTYSDILKEMKHHGMDDFVLNVMKLKQSREINILFILFLIVRRKNVFDCAGD